MEVGPTLHYFMGGIRVNPDTQESTTVTGLFAAGECSGGMHGANRLGGNSLSDLLVFGCLAGEGAAAYVGALPSTPKVNADQVQTCMRRATAPLNRESGENPFMIHEELQDLMQSHVGIIREGADLENALSGLETLEAKAANVKAHGSAQYNAGWNEALDLRAFLITAGAVTLAASTRQESRGGHTRIDFEGESAEWGKVNTVVKKGKDGRMEIRKEPLTAMPDELAKIANAKIEDLEAGRV